MKKINLVSVAFVAVMLLSLGIMTTQTAWSDSATQTCPCGDDCQCGDCQCATVTSQCGNDCGCADGSCLQNDACTCAKQACACANCAK